MKNAFFQETRLLNLVLFTLLIGNCKQAPIENSGEKASNHVSTRPQTSSFQCNGENNSTAGSIDPLYYGFTINSPNLGTLTDSQNGTDPKTILCDFHKTVVTNMLSSYLTGKLGLSEVFAGDLGGSDAALSLREVIVSEVLLERLKIGGNLNAGSQANEEAAKKLGTAEIINTENVGVSGKIDNGSAAVALGVKYETATFKATYEFIFTQKYGEYTDNIVITFPNDMKPFEYALTQTDVISTAKFDLAGILDLVAKVPKAASKLLQSVLNIKADGSVGFESQNLRVEVPKTSRDTLNSELVLATKNLCNESLKAFADRDLNAFIGRYKLPTSGTVDMSTIRLICDRSLTVNQSGQVVEVINSTFAAENDAYDGLTDDQKNFLININAEIPNGIYPIDALEDYESGEKVSRGYEQDLTDFPEYKLEDGNDKSHRYVATFDVNDPLIHKLIAYFPRRVYLHELTSNGHALTGVKLPTAGTGSQCKVGYIVPMKSEPDSQCRNQGVNCTVRAVFLCGRQGVMGIKKGATREAFLNKFVVSFTDSTKEDLLTVPQFSNAKGNILEQLESCLKSNENMTISTLLAPGDQLSRDNTVLSDYARALLVQLGVNGFYYFGQNGVAKQTVNLRNQINTLLSTNTIKNEIYDTRHTVSNVQDLYADDYFARGALNGIISTPNWKNIKAVARRCMLGNSSDFFTQRLERLNNLAH